MEKKFELQYDGQAVNQEDINQLGETSGLADDRVFAELYRMAYFNGTTTARGITATDGPLLSGNSDGTLSAWTFRAFVGSRTPMATDAKATYRDSRSSLSVADGGTNIITKVPIANNATGNPRWDLIYATLRLDQLPTAITRKVKAPGTGVVSAVSTATYRNNTVTINVVTGSPSATPVYPAVPADTTNTYNIVLGHVKILAGHNSATTISPSNIVIDAPVLHVAPVTGALSASPATHNLVLKTVDQQSFTARPDHILSSTTVGGERLLLVIDMRNNTLANQPNVNGEVLDSRDWRQKFVEWRGYFGPQLAKATWSTFLLVDPGADAWPNGIDIPRVSSDVLKGNAVSGLSFTSWADNAVVAGGTSTICNVTPAQVVNMATGTSVGLYVDQSTGQLKLYKLGNPKCIAVFFLDFTGTQHAMR